MKNTQHPIADRVRQTMQAIIDRHDGKTAGPYADLDIHCEVLGRIVIVTVRAHLEEYGKLIGTGGIMVDALKYLTAVLGYKLKVKSQLAIVKPATRYTGPLTKFANDPNWKHAAALQLVKDIAGDIFFEPVEVVANDGDETTVITITIAHNEQMADMAPGISDALTTVLRALGKATGRDEIIADVIKAESTAEKR